jgi:LAS superfamily LD-carboxypeptidase LdcB
MELLVLFCRALINFGNKVGSIVMRTRWVVVMVSVLASSLILTALPAVASEETVVNYCASKSSAKVRPIYSGKCLKSEWSLGAKEIKRGKVRPKALVPKMSSRFKAAKLAAKKNGHTLNMTSGFRSYARQKYLFEQAIKRHGSAAAASKWVLPPGKSNHPWGIAIDVNYGSGGAKGKKAAAWLEKNGYKYGLCRRYKNEWWHFEPLVAPGTKCPKMEPYPS